MFGQVMALIENDQSDVSCPQPLNSCPRTLVEPSDTPRLLRENSACFFTKAFHLFLKVIWIFQLQILQPFLSGKVVRRFLQIDEFLYPQLQRCFL